MKKQIYLIATILLSYIVNAQVGINTETPKATLDIIASPLDKTKVDGFIPPRLTGDELQAKDNLYTSTDGQTAAIVYVTSAVTTSSTKTVNVTGAGYYFFDGSVWQKLNTTVSTMQDLRLLGNNNHITQDAGLGSNGTSVGTGTDNIGIGANTFAANTTGSRNTVIGNNALKASTTGNNALAIGNSALKSATSIGSGEIIVIGTKALQNITDVDETGDALVIGNNTFNDATTANLDNEGGVFIGHNMLSKKTELNVDEGSPLFLGNNILTKSTSSDDLAGIIIGNNILQGQTTGSYDGAIIIGDSALPSITTGTVNGNSVIIANVALPNITTGTIANTVILGNGALNAATTSDGNTAIGKGALANVSTGSNNTAIGNGANVDATVAGSGAFTNATAVGFNAKVGASNTVVLGATRNAANTALTTSVAIGANKTDASTILDVTSTNKGILIPRVNLTSNTLDLDGVSGQATGLLVYNTGNTTVLAGFYYWDGAQWKQVLTAAVNAATSETVASVGTLNNYTSPKYYRELITPDGRFSFRVVRASSSSAIMTVEYKSIGSTREIRVMARLENGNSDSGTAATVTAAADTWQSTGITTSSSNIITPGASSYPLSRIYFTTTDATDKVMYNVESQYYESSATCSSTTSNCTGTKASLKILQTTGN